MNFATNILANWWIAKKMMESSGSAAVVTTSVAFFVDLAATIFLVCLIVFFIAQKTARKRLMVEIDILPEAIGVMRRHGWMSLFMFQKVWHLMLQFLIFAMLFGGVIQLGLWGAGLESLALESYSMLKGVLSGIVAAVSTLAGFTAAVSRSS